MQIIKGLVDENLGACRALKAILLRDKTAVRFWELISPNACRSEGGLMPLPALP